MKLTLDELVWALPLAWRDDTKEPSYKHGPLIAGQCTTSSLLVKKHLGGDIMRCSIGAEYGTIHYFNELPSGMWLDTTRAQFLTRSPVRAIRKNPPESLYIFSDTWNQVDRLEFWVMEVLRDRAV